MKPVDYSILARDGMSRLVQAKAESGVSRPPSAYSGKVEAARERELREACAGFEAIFINQLLKTMRESVPESTFFGKSLQRDIYTSMFDMQVADRVAHGKGIGIGDLLYRQLSRTLK